MKKLAIIQPGRLGDLIICLPIAKHYHDLGFNVHWPILDEYKSLFNNIDYVTTIPINSDITNCVRKAYLETKSFKKIIDLSFGFHYSNVHLAYHGNTSFASNFVESKYKLAEVPLTERWNLKYKRNTKKEDELFDKLYKGKDYYLVHGDSSQGSHINFIGDNIIKVRPIDGFNIFDWRKLAINAEKIHCVDSSFCNFIESDKSFKHKQKTYIQAKRMESKWGWTTLRNNWVIDNPN